MKMIQRPSYVEYTNGYATIDITTLHHGLNTLAVHI